MNLKIKTHRQGSIILCFERLFEYHITHYIVIKKLSLDEPKTFFLGSRTESINIFACNLFDKFLDYSTLDISLATMV